MRFRCQARGSPAVASFEVPGAAADVTQADRMLRRVVDFEQRYAEGGRNGGFSMVFGPFRLDFGPFFIVFGPFWYGFARFRPWKGDLNGLVHVRCGVDQRLDQLRAMYEHLEEHLEKVAAVERQRLQEAVAIGGSKRALLGLCHPLPLLPTAGLPCLLAQHGWGRGSSGRLALPVRRRGLA